MKTELVCRILSVIGGLCLAGAQFIFTRSPAGPDTEMLTLTCFFYMALILLASIGFGVLGTFVASTAGTVLASLVHFRVHLAIPIHCILSFALLAVTLYLILARHQKECVQKRIESHDLEALWNDRNEKYSKHKGAVRAYKNKIARFSSLRQLGEKLISTLSLDETSQKTLEVTAALIAKGDRSSLYLLDDNLKSFTPTSQIALSEKGLSLPQDSADPFNHWIIKNRQNLFIENLHADFRFEATAKQSPVASLIAAPLITENKLIGAIRIESHAERAFQLEDLRILATLANIASTSLKNARLYSETLELSIRDGLTGLFVPIHFHQEFGKAFELARKEGEVLSVIMADIDDFKKVNDRFGHPVGDSILKKISGVFRQEIDETHVPTRYGGEEFVAFFRGRDIEKALQTAQAIRSQIQAMSFEIRREKVAVTVSLGISQMNPGDTYKDHLLHRADAALYEAKRTGKNRICTG